MSRQELLQFDRTQAMSNLVTETPSSASIASQTQLNEQLRLEAEQNEQRLSRRLRAGQPAASR